MKNTQLNRLSSLPLNHSKVLKNRIVIPPMASMTANENGSVTEKTLKHYFNLTKSGASLLMVEYSFVHSSGRSEENQLGISSDTQINGLKRLADTIKKEGLLSAIQLTHAGGKSERAFTGGTLQSPSGIKVPVKDRELEVPDEMSLKEISLWKESFIQAAQRAYEAGFDMVELHAAHGYGLNQFLSPLTNKREDQYGGSILNRARIVLEIIFKIKELYPSLLLSVRMPGQDFSPEGLTQEDAKYLALIFEEAGVDILNISSGIGGWRRPGPRIGEGYLVNEAAFIKQFVKVPVIGVGGIETSTYIDDVISSHKISLAAVGRAILNDPIKFRRQLQGERHA